MLWLKRKRGESIVIEDGAVEVVVGKIDGDTVRVGVQAPNSVSIERGEVWLARERACGSVTLKLEEVE